MTAGALSEGQVFSLPGVETENETPSVRALVRQVQDETGSADPREIASKVLADIPDELLRPLLAEVMPEYVRQVMKGGRHSATGAPPASSKVAAVRGWHERLMSQPIDVSGGKGEWKALRDCTRDELLAVAQYRRETAARNLATAEKYEALAKILPAKKTVGQLAADVVASVFGRAAA